MTEHHVDNGNEPLIETRAVQERSDRLSLFGQHSIAAVLVPLGVALQFQRLKVVHALAGPLAPEDTVELVCCDRGPVDHQMDAVHLCQLTHALNIGGTDPLTEQLG